MQKWVPSWWKQISFSHKSLKNLPPHLRSNMDSRLVLYLKRINKVFVNNIVEAALFEDSNDLPLATTFQILSSALVCVYIPPTCCKYQGQSPAPSPFILFCSPKSGIPAGIIFNQLSSWTIWKIFVSRLWSISQFFPLPDVQLKYGVLSIAFHLVRFHSEILWLVGFGGLYNGYRKRQK